MLVPTFLVGTVVPAMIVGTAVPIIIALMAYYWKSCVPDICPECVEDWLTLETGGCVDQIFCTEWLKADLHINLSWVSAVTPLPLHSFSRQAWHQARLYAGEDCPVSCIGHQGLAGHVGAGAVLAHHLRHYVCCLLFFLYFYRSYSLHFAISEWEVSLVWHWQHTVTIVFYLSETKTKSTRWNC